MKNRIIEEWKAHDRKGHSLASLYAIHRAPPMGMAELGVHTGCQECDDEQAREMLNP
jgi:hypothetical protein